MDAAPWRVEPVERAPDDVLVAAVMRLAPRKRPVPLLRMLRDARAALPGTIRLRATVVGEGPQRGAMERYLERHAMTGWVDLPGRWDRDGIRELYRRADLYVAPAVLESFGIAALEARSAGLPVLARSQSGVREFVRDGVEGVLAASDGDLAAALARLAASPAERQRIAAHNRRVAPAVTWERVLARAEEEYQRATRIAGAPGRR
jgi:glycosyltransferase involved in cell wall biosynthesis